MTPVKHPPERGMPAQAIFNRFVTWLLSSPLHGLLSRHLMLLTYTGRRSGTQRTVPITYLQNGRVVIAFCEHETTWWKNLRGGAPVTVQLRGGAYPGIATPISDDPERITPLFVAFLRKNRQAGTFNAVPFDADGEPNAGALTQAMQTKVMIQIDLTALR
jgi:hypothetical protein